MEFFLRDNAFQIFQGLRSTHLAMPVGDNDRLMASVLWDFRSNQEFGRYDYTKL